MAGNGKKTAARSTAARKTAFCGVFAALSMVMLYIGGLTVLDLSVLVVCSFITVIAAIEAGTKTAWVYSAVTSALALILLPSKLYALEYILFSAVYPLIRPLFSRLPQRLAFVLRVVVLDAMLLACVLVGQFVLTVGDGFFTLGAATMLGGTAFLALYELSLDRIIPYYLVKLRNKIKIYRFL